MVTKAHHTLGLILSIGIASCSSSESTKESEKSSSSSETKTTEPSETDTELKDKPSYASGSCSGTVGCIQGFISHGMKLTLTPDSSGGTDKDARGEKLTTSTYEFKDAQDFGDRFDTAFLKPLVPEDKFDQYTFRIAPTVKRDNFASGFELYSEGIEANDEKVKMEGEGNFQLGDIAPYDKVALRTVKTFRIEIEKKADAADGTPDIVRAVTCLEIDVSLENLDVKAGETTKVGGLRNFKFYYTESDEFCTEEKVGGPAQARDIEANKLPATQPAIP